MRSILIAAIGLLIVSGMFSCSEDFTVAAPYRQITIVSGILDADDTAHYIRIQKAFMDDSKSAIEMSENPDSSFYGPNEITVQLKEFDSTQTVLLNTINLNRVDANQEGYVKNPAISEQQFFTSPNYAYKFKKNDLNPRLWYKLYITNNNTGQVDSSDYLGIINNDTSRFLQGFYVPEFEFANFKVKFSSTNPASRFRIFAYMPKNAKYAEGFIRFHYVDRNIVTGDTERHQLDYSFDTEESTLPGNSFELAVANNSIYSYLISAMGDAPENTIRLMDSCDVYIYAAGPELYYYNRINLGQSSGLTSDNIQPNYSNFAGNDIIGILSTRTMRIYRNAAIDEITIDSLQKNASVQGLRIRGITED